MRPLRSGSATALLLAAALIAGAPAEPAFTDADAAAVNAVDHRFTTAMKAGDWDAWSNLMTDDVAFFPPNGPVIEGRAAVRVFHQRAREVPLRPPAAAGRVVAPEPEHLEFRSAASGAGDLA